MTGVICIVAGGRATSALSASASPSGVYNSRVGTGSVTSPTTTATAIGGTGPYTYTWTFLSGTSMTITSAATAATAFTATVPTGTVRSATYRCTVTDSLGAVAVADVTVDLEAL